MQNSEIRGGHGEVEASQGSKRRFIRSPRTLADLESKKGEAITCILMLETCCTYLVSGEMYMVGYRQNDLDDCVDIDGLLAKMEPVSLESIVQPPCIIQSYIRNMCSCPILAVKDICFALTNEYSILLCTKGESLSEFHFSEILESFFSDEQLDEFARREQAQTIGQAHGHVGSIVTMHLSEGTEILAVAAHSYIFVVTLDLKYILNNVHIYAQDMDELANDMNSHDPGATLLAHTQCVRGSICIDCINWTQFFRAPFACEPEPESAVPAEPLQLRVEMLAVWCADLTASTSCALACAGNGSWVQFLPLTRDTNTAPWQHHVHEPGYESLNPPASTPAPVLLNIKPSREDHESWVTAVCTGNNMPLSCTGDTMGFLVFWQALTGEERQGLLDNRLARHNRRKLRLEALASQKDEERKTIEQEHDATTSIGHESKTGFSLENDADDLTASVEASLLLGGFRKLFKINFSHGNPISVIVRAQKKNSDMFWIGDSSGAVTSIAVLPESFNYQCITKVHILNPGSSPTVIEWKPTIGFLQSDSEREGRLRFLCHSAGMVMEVQLQSTACLFNAASGPSFAPNHRAAVEVCAVLLESELLITAGTSNAINVWNLKNCTLETTILSPDLYCTHIGAFDTGFVAGGFARLLVGHANGNIHDYVLHRKDVDPTAKREEIQFKASSLGSVHRGVSHLDVTSVDILDTMQDQIPGNDGTLSQELNSISATIVGHMNGLEMSVAGGNAYTDDRGVSTCTATIASTYEYCPMPVTSIIFSNLGLYFSFCYANQYVIIHDWERNTVLLQLEFDQVLLSVSALLPYEFEDVHSDSLVLALHGKQGVKFLDALSRNFIEPLTLDTQGKSIQACALWSFADPLNSSMRQVGGVFIEHGLRAYTVESNKSLLLVFENKQRRFEGSDEDSLDSVVLGVTGITEVRSPWAAAWGLRQAVMLRWQDSTFIRTVEYAIANDKCRFICALSLKMIPRIRANRAVIVLSDGTCAVVHL